MHVRTITLTVFAPRDTVFGFLADIEYLPVWTAGFCEWIELHSEGWWVYTPAGELLVESKVDDIAGQIDLSFKHPSGWKLVIPVRVRNDGDGGCIVRLTCAQPDGFSDEQYERMIESLLAGLRELPARLPRELAEA